MEQGATSVLTTKGQAPARKNLSWSKQEERVLVDGLKELIVRGYKCDNGFKSGYDSLLEGMIAKAVPGSQIKAKPHIDSKIHVWKRLYHALKQMLGPNGSGLGVLNSEYKIDATDEKWTSQIKKDPGAHALRNKSFPFYDDWKEIFGNDRADGENAQTCPDVMEETQAPPQNEMPFEFKSTPDTPPFTENFNPDIQTSYRGEGSSATKTSGKKRKTILDDPYIDRLGEFFNRTDVSIGNMTTKLVDQLNEGHKNRQRLFEVLQGFDFMSPDEILSVTQYMARNPNELDMWWSFPDSFKIAKVKKIIEEL